jgi:RNA polymerase sigma-70 factor, ECF subfamily
MTALVLEHERTLIAAAQADPGAFSVLYERHVDRVYAYALHSLHDPMAAEDVVSETFYRALQNLSRYEWRGVPFAAWLYRIASNALATRYRQPATLPLDADGDLQDRDPGPEAQALRREQRRTLHTAIALLPLLERQVLSLRYGQGLCYRDIALLLGRTEGAVKQGLYRARRHLSDDLCSWASDDEGGERP